MAPLIVLIAALLIFRGVGALGIKRLASWRDATRWGLAVMFLFTGLSHFSSMKHDLAAMIPPPLPSGLWVIYATGILLIAGAIGLLIPRFQRLAGICLMVLLIAMFPANVHAALNELTLRGGAVTPLIPRTFFQLLWIGLLWWSAVRRQSPAAATAPV